MSDTITVVGNIATAPDHRRTPSGATVTSFRVASGQRRYDRTTGTWIDAGTNFYTVSTYRALADNAFVSFRKGDRIVVTGRLKVRDWETSTSKGTSIDIDAEAIGHDLLWGTTRFEKSSANASTSGEHAASESGAQADSWSAPGSDGWEPTDDAQEAVGDTPDEQVRELALVGASVDADDTPTPF